MYVTDIFVLYLSPLGFCMAKIGIVEVDNYQKITANFCSIYGKRGNCLQKNFIHFVLNFFSSHK